MNIAATKCRGFILLAICLIFMTVPGLLYSSEKDRTQSGISRSSSNINLKALKYLPIEVPDDFSRDEIVSSIEILRSQGRSGPEMLWILENFISIRGKVNMQDKAYTESLNAAIAYYDGWLRRFEREVSEKLQDFSRHTPYNQIYPIFANSAYSGYELSPEIFKLLNLSNVNPIFRYLASSKLNNEEVVLNELVYPKLNEKQIKLIDKSMGNKGELLNYLTGLTAEVPFRFLDFRSKLIALRDKIASDPSATEYLFRYANWADLTRGHETAYILKMQESSSKWVEPKPPLGLFGTDQESFLRGIFEVDSYRIEERGLESRDFLLRYLIGREKLPILKRIAGELTKRDLERCRIEVINESNINRKVTSLVRKFGFDLNATNIALVRSKESGQIKVVRSKVGEGNGLFIIVPQNIELHKPDMFSVSSKFVKELSRSFMDMRISEFMLSVNTLYYYVHMRNTAAQWDFPELTVRGSVGKDMKNMAQRTIKMIAGFARYDLEAVAKQLKVDELAFDQALANPFRSIIELIKMLDFNFFVEISVYEDFHDFIKRCKKDGRFDLVEKFFDFYLLVQNKLKVRTNGDTYRFENAKSAGISQFSKMLGNFASKIDFIRSDALYRGRIAKYSEGNKIPESGLDELLRIAELVAQDENGTYEKYFKEMIFDKVALVILSEGRDLKRSITFQRLCAKLGLESPALYEIFLRISKRTGIKAQDLYVLHKDFARISETVKKLAGLPPYTGLGADINRDPEVLLADEKNREKTRLEKLLADKYSLESIEGRFVAEEIEEELKRLEASNRPEDTKMRNQLREGLKNIETAELGLGAGRNALDEFVKVRRDRFSEYARLSEVLSRAYELENGERHMSTIPHYEEVIEKARQLKSKISSPAFNSNLDRALLLAEELIAHNEDFTARKEQIGEQEYELLKSRIINRLKGVLRELSYLPQPHRGDVREQETHIRNAIRRMENINIDGIIFESAMQGIRQDVSLAWHQLEQAADIGNAYKKKAIDNLKHVYELIAKMTSNEGIAVLQREIQERIKYLRKVDRKLENFQKRASLSEHSMEAEYHKIENARSFIDIYARRKNADFPAVMKAVCDGTVSTLDALIAARYPDNVASHESLYLFNDWKNKTVSEMSKINSSVEKVKDGKFFRELAEYKHSLRLRLARINTLNDVIKRYAQLEGLRLELEQKYPGDKAIWGLDKAEKIILERFLQAEKVLFMKPSKTDAEKDFVLKKLLRDVESFGRQAYESRLEDVVLRVEDIKTLMGYHIEKGDQDFRATVEAITEEIHRASLLLSREYPKEKINRIRALLGYLEESFQVRRGLQNKALAPEKSTEFITNTSNKVLSLKSYLESKNIMVITPLGNTDKGEAYLGDGNKTTVEINADKNGKMNELVMWKEAFNGLIIEALRRDKALGEKVLRSLDARMKFNGGDPSDMLEMIMRQTEGFTYDWVEKMLEEGISEREVEEVLERMKRTAIATVRKNRSRILEVANASNLQRRDETPRNRAEERSRDEAKQVHGSFASSSVSFTASYLLSRMAVDLIDGMRLRDPIDYLGEMMNPQFVTMLSAYHYAGIGADKVLDSKYVRSILNGKNIRLSDKMFFRTFAGLTASFIAVDIIFTRGIYREYPFLDDDSLSMGEKAMKLLVKASEGGKLGLLSSIAAFGTTNLLAGAASRVLPQAAARIMGARLITIAGTPITPMGILTCAVALVAAHYAQDAAMEINRGLDTLTVSELEEKLSGSPSMQENMWKYYPDANTKAGSFLADGLTKVKIWGQKLIDNNVNEDEYEGLSEKSYYLRKLIEARDDILHGYWMGRLQMGLNEMMQDWKKREDFIYRVATNRSEFEAASASYGMADNPEVAMSDAMRQDIKNRSAAAIKSSWDDRWPEEKRLAVLDRELVEFYNERCPEILQTHDEVMPKAAELAASYAKWNEEILKDPEKYELTDDDVAFLNDRNESLVRAVVSLSSSTMECRSLSN